MKSPPLSDNEYSLSPTEEKKLSFSKRVSNHGMRIHRLSIIVMFLLIQYFLYDWCTEKSFNDDRGNKKIYYGKRNTVEDAAEGSDSERILPHRNHGLYLTISKKNSIVRKFPERNDIGNEDGYEKYWNQAVRIAANEVSSRALQDNVMQVHKTANNMYMNLFGARELDSVDLFFLRVMMRKFVLQYFSDRLPLLSVTDVAIFHHTGSMEHISGVHGIGMRLPFDVQISYAAYTGDDVQEEVLKFVILESFKERNIEFLNRLVVLKSVITFVFVSDTFFQPSAFPSSSPSVLPTYLPSNFPTSFPSQYPTKFPSDLPSFIPSQTPSTAPSVMPTFEPSGRPSLIPTNLPNKSPSIVPTFSPSNIPSIFPSMKSSFSPSYIPTGSPTYFPSTYPSLSPSHMPSHTPSIFPSLSPSFSPSVKPSNTPSLLPSVVPSYFPSLFPSKFPTVSPSFHPSENPSHKPSCSPSYTPSFEPSSFPSIFPSHIPSVVPSSNPSPFPSKNPSLKPSKSPIFNPSWTPTDLPSSLPSSTPSQDPTSSFKNMSTNVFIVITGLPISDDVIVGKTKRIMEETTKVFIQSSLPEDDLVQVDINSVTVLSQNRSKKNLYTSDLIVEFLIAGEVRPYKPPPSFSFSAAALTGFTNNFEDFRTRLAAASSSFEQLVNTRQTLNELQRTDNRDEMSPNNWILFGVTGSVVILIFSLLTSIYVTLKRKNERLREIHCSLGPPASISKIKPLQGATKEHVSIALQPKAVNMTRSIAQTGGKIKELVLNEGKGGRENETLDIINSRQFGNLQYSSNNGFHKLEVNAEKKNSKDMLYQSRKTSIELKGFYTANKKISKKAGVSKEDALAQITEPRKSGLLSKISLSGKVDSVFSQMSPPSPIWCGQNEKFMRPTDEIMQYSRQLPSVQNCKDSS